VLLFFVLSHSRLVVVVEETAVMAQRNTFTPSEEISANSVLFIYLLKERFFDNTFLSCFRLCEGLPYVFAKRKM
jgi:hypothetical protein